MFCFVSLITISYNKNFIVVCGRQLEEIEYDFWYESLFYFLRAWESLKAATCSKSLVIVYNGTCLIQIGMAAESPEDNKAVIVNTDKLMQGSVYKGIMKSKARK